MYWSMVSSALGTSCRCSMFCFMFTISSRSRHGVWPNHGREPQAKYTRRCASDSRSSRLPDSNPRWQFTEANAGLPSIPPHSLKGICICVKGSLYCLAILKSMRYMVLASCPEPMRTLEGLMSRCMKLRRWMFCNLRICNPLLLEFSELRFNSPVGLRSCQQYSVRTTNGTIQTPRPKMGRGIQRQSRCGMLLFRKR